MSENISSSVLFHFTSSEKKLLNILKFGFHPHYCPEYIFGLVDLAAAQNNRSPNQAAPMVCFCDLPLSLISRHLKKYGKYGIGLTKRWGIEKGVAPVFYTHDQSQTFEPLSNRNWAARSERNLTAVNELLMLTAYMKPVRGNAWRRGQVKRDVHFYDEREWRYVPRLQIGEKLFISRREYEDDSKRSALHAALKSKHTLRVTPQDIIYLMVPDDSRVIKLFKHLVTLYGAKDAILPQTAIISVDCIVGDV
jgi:Putative abortive phage resistance protein AbiGi, antitoxin